MTRKCTCIRCQAAELVRNIYPNLSDQQVLLTAEKLVNVIREIRHETAA